jgi:hypothetical protein
VIASFRRVFLVAAFLLVCCPAWAEKRVALVIGNSTYQNADHLANPANDAMLVAAALKRAGFDVVESRLDLKSVDMRRALRDFHDQTVDADVAVVYYAGHGIEIDGTNFLIPIDATLERDTDVYDEAFSLDRVLIAIEPAKQLRLVIVDACRNNPFADTMKRTLGSRSIGRGLARVEPATTNTLVAFAAKAGLTALDGNDKDSPYATALVKYIATPGLDLRRAFGFVRDDVLKATGNRQEPYVYGSLGGEDVSLVPAKSVVATGQSDARTDYQLALQIGNKDALNAFLVQYPDGFYANLAKLQLGKLAAAEMPAAAPGKPSTDRQQPAAKTDRQSDVPKAEANNRPFENESPKLENSKPASPEQVAAAGQGRIENGSDNKDISATAAFKGADPAASMQPPAANSDTTPQESKVATLSQPEPPALPSELGLAKLVQTELNRVGCFTGSVDGEWGAASQRSLSLFNRNAGTKFDIKTASTDVLDAIKLKPERVCPLICEHGFRANGDHCSRIVCAEGSFLNDDDVCEKRRGKTPTARHDRGDRPERDQGRTLPEERAAPELSAPRPRLSRAGSGQGSGQIVCDSIGCRPVQRGCHLDFRTTAQGGPVEGGGGNVQICN